MSDQIALQDRHGRIIRKLRVSLLDTCNFRCQYCMPENAKFMPGSSRMSVDEIVEICTVLVKNGIREMRLTGGEPTLHPRLIEIANRLSDLELKKLGMTTNGWLLAKYLPDLVHTKCKNLNISLDSLDPKNFAFIARRDGFDATMGSIFKAKEMGFNVKLNMVVIKGVNDHEVVSFVEFGRKNDIEVRFLELMAIGEASRLGGFMAAETILENLAEFFNYRRVQTEKDSTSERYQIDGGSFFGIIAPVTRSFCGNCSRWRLTADGFLRACLMSDVGINLRGKKDVEIELALKAVLNLKPLRGLNHTHDLMHAIGG